MSLLYIDACPRAGETSRTRRLAEAFLAAYREAHPGEAVERIDLPAQALVPFTGDMVIRREELIDKDLLDDAMFTLARQFACAGGIAIAAPYWDFSFPSMLKVYIEHIFVRKITFIYEDSGPVGLCRGGRALYLTTSGSPIGANNFGGDYLGGILNILGIGAFDQVRAEGLDIWGADVGAIMEEAMNRARALARRF